MMTLIEEPERKRSEKPRLKLRDMMGKTRMNLRRTPGAWPQDPGPCVGMQSI